MKGAIVLGAVALVASCVFAQDVFAQRSGSGEGSYRAVAPGHVGRPRVVIITRLWRRRTRPTARIAAFASSRQSATPPFGSGDDARSLRRRHAVPSYRPFPA